MKKNVLTLQTKNTIHLHIRLPLSPWSPLCSVIPYDISFNVYKIKPILTSSPNALSKPYALPSSKTSPSAACISSKPYEQAQASKLHSIPESHEKRKKSSVLAPNNLRTYG